MKKIVLSLAVLATGVAAQAQEGFGFKKGDVLLEGNVGFNTTNDKNSDTKENTFNFTPKAGYFINDKFALGIELGIGSDKTTVNGTDTDKNSNFDAGVFGRYYFLELGQRFKTYAEVGVAYKSGKATLAEVKYSGFGAKAGLGINYFVTPKMAINFGLSNVLAFNTMKVKGAEAVSEFDANVNVFNNFFNTATFGLTFKL